MKRPMSVRIKKRAVTKYTTEYDCPSCKTNITGHEIDDSVTRFKCGYCLRELIVRE
jgi:predicted RNA-binding Zn-ribbon protein involved in translation (DUF1610 family)